jgi:tyrosyl-tRNA synthetase
MFSRPVSRDETKINELLTRGVAEVIPSADSLKKLLLSGKRLRIKLGIDPTSPNLHLGRSIPLLKLKDFQDLGHAIVFIIGDATGVVGDTSDKDSERPMLSDSEVQNNLESYVSQVAKILDRRRLEVRRNSEWLLKLNYADIGEHANLFSVSDFIARDNIKRRLDEGKRVSLREVLYPLMQGYDSVAINADVELGGTDQRFNLLAGRSLQEKAGQPPQHIVTMDLILGTDGRKMSSSWGNTINLNDPAQNMFGKVMSVPDDLVRTYFTHATRLPLADVEKYLAGHPKDAKMALAEELVRMYHGEKAAAGARVDFDETFSKGGMPADIPTVALGGRDLVDALVAAGIVASKSDYRRLEKANAVTTLSDDASGKVLKIGKHRFVKITK